MGIHRYLTVVAACALAATMAAQPPAAEAPKREPGLYATIQTTLGSITLKMYEKESPVTVKNFVDLAMGRKEWTDPKTGQRVKRPLYNGLIFHRVIPGFMIQGGDPMGTGTGGTDVIRDEFHQSLKFDGPGRLAMANAGPNTGSCQFFIGETPTPHLNGLHTIFGQVIEGQDVASQIARVPRDGQDRPRTPVRIVRVSFQREGALPAAAAKPAAKAAGAATTTKKAAPKTTTPKATTPKTTTPKAATPKTTTPKTATPTKK